jgi:uncharacterized protein (DUF2164 family)
MTIHRLHVYSQGEELPRMPEIELSREQRADAIASLQRYFEENLPEPLGDMPAGHLLDYFLEEIGSVIYNRAIADAQARLQLRLEDLAGELHAPEFAYWSRMDAKRRVRR